MSTGNCEALFSIVGRYRPDIVTGKILGEVCLYAGMDVVMPPYKITPQDTLEGLLKENHSVMLDYQMRCFSAMIAAWPCRYKDVFAALYNGPSAYYYSSEDYDGGDGEMNYIAEGIKADNFSSILDEILPTRGSEPLSFLFGELEDACLFDLAEWSMLHAKVGMVPEWSVTANERNVPTTDYQLTCKFEGPFYYPYYQRITTETYYSSLNSEPQSIVHYKITPRIVLNETSFNFLLPEITNYNVAMLEKEFENLVYCERSRWSRFLAQPSSVLKKTSLTT